jgi:hypothetical protein
MKMYLMQWEGEKEDGFWAYILTREKYLPLWKTIASYNLPQEYETLGVQYPNIYEILDYPQTDKLTKLRKEDKRYKKAQKIFENVDAYELLSP